MAVGNQTEDTFQAIFKLYMNFYCADYYEVGHY